ncbi:unnamed protein product [Schistosoma curassoni]|uniref:Uncharacterized protein n=1 Tax=Schistosoma curassoni TaxID=6186 RepID=A0A183K1G4_9TREM|nr:unnamed protein product [Schistosoma curassoni]
MVVGGSQQETLDLRFVLLCTRQQGVPVILKGLMHPDGFDLVLPSFTKSQCLRDRYCLSVYFHFGVNVPQPEI